MKKHGNMKGIVVSILAPAVLGIGWMSSVVRAEEEHETKAPPAQHAAPTTKPAGPRVSLEKVMEEMGRKFKALSKQAKDDAKLDSSLVLVSELEQLTLTAKSATPGLKKFPEADRPKMLGEYKKMMGSLLSSLTDLESALIDKNAAKIDEAINNIKEIQKQGHEDMKVKKEGGEEHEEH